MTYRTHNVGAITVVHLAGRITRDESTSLGGITGCEQLRKLIYDLMKDGRKNVLLNLRDVTHVDNCGIHELFSCFEDLRERRGILKLAGPIERVHDIIRLTRLDTVIDVIEEEVVALRSFSEREYSSRAA